jgi:hypothetical protein
MTPPIRKETEDVVMGLLDGSSLTDSQRLQAGITSADHLSALRDAVDEATETQGIGVVLTALDACLGDGAKLTAFVQRYASHWSGIRYTTPLDDLTPTG